MLLSSVIFKKPPFTLDDAKTTIEVAELLLGSFHHRFTRFGGLMWHGVSVGTMMNLLGLSLVSRSVLVHFIYRFVV